jgi:hypothetical protein
MTIARPFVALLLASVVAAASPAAGQESRPFPSAHITEQQWQTYFDEVRKRADAEVLAAPNSKADSEGVSIAVRSENAVYYFTKPPNPAHPAVVRRAAVERDRTVYIDTTGYYAGSQTAFDNLFRSFGSSNARVREQFKSGN